MYTIELGSNPFAVERAETYAEARSIVADFKRRYPGENVYMSAKRSKDHQTVYYKPGGGKSPVGVAW